MAGNHIAYTVGAFIRWVFRGCKTNFQDELDCKDGWFPFLGEYENALLAFCLSLIIAAIGSGYYLIIIEKVCNFIKSIF